MRDNRELYKAAFSKLHASTELSFLDRAENRPHRKLKKSAAVCLAAACILLVATTAAFAMTGESPIEFFKSFFKNDSGRLPDELNGSYVLVGDQTVMYENKTITFEGYSYTVDTLLAKFRVEDMESAGFLTMDWDSAPGGGVIIAVRMNLYDSPNEDTGTSAEDTKIIVWDREAGRESPVGLFHVGQPSSAGQITLNQDQLQIRDSCLSIGFSRALTTGEIAAVIIDGAEYPVEG